MNLVRERAKQDLTSLNASTLSYCLTSIDRNACISRNSSKNFTDMGDNELLNKLVSLNKQTCFYSFLMIKH